MTYRQAILAALAGAATVGSYLVATSGILTGFLYDAFSPATASTFFEVLRLLFGLLTGVGLILVMRALGAGWVRSLVTVGTILAAALLLLGVAFYNVVNGYLPSYIDFDWLVAFSPLVHVPLLISLSAPSRSRTEERVSDSTSPAVIKLLLVSLAVVIVFVLALDQASVYQTGDIVFSGRSWGIETSAQWLAGLVAWTVLPGTAALLAGHSIWNAQVSANERGRPRRWLDGLSGHLSHRRAVQTIAGGVALTGAWLMSELFSRVSYSLTSTAENMPSLESFASAVYVAKETLISPGVLIGGGAVFLLALGAGWSRAFLTSCAVFVLTPFLGVPEGLVMDAVDFVVTLPYGKISILEVLLTPVLAFLLLLLGAPRFPVIGKLLVAGATALFLVTQVLVLLAFSVPQIPGVSGFYLFWGISLVALVGLSALAARFVPSAHSAGRRPSGPGRHGTP